MVGCCGRSKIFKDGIEYDTEKWFAPAGSHPLNVKKPSKAALEIKWSMSSSSPTIPRLSSHTLKLQDFQIIL